MRILEKGNICPVCAKHAFDVDGGYEICPVCGWENDRVQNRDHSFWGGANFLSVNEARIEYFLLGSPAAEAARELSAQFAQKQAQLRAAYAENSPGGEKEPLAEALRKAKDEYIDAMAGLLRGLMEN